MWTCPECRAKIDDSFEVCWSCGTSPDGEEDPTFARADDVGPTADPPWKPGHKVRKDLDLELGELAEPEIELVACYWASDTFEAMFLAGQLVWEGIPATADAWDLRIVFAGFCGLLPAGPYFGPRVRVDARDLPRALPWLAGYEERRRARRESRHAKPSEPVSKRVLVGTAEPSVIRVEGAFRRCRWNPDHLA